MTSFYATKDPQATLDYGLEWSDWLAAGDTIVSASWAYTGPDAALTLSDEAIVSTVTTVRAAGGTVGAMYDLTCTLTTDNALVTERSITLAILDA